MDLGYLPDVVRSEIFDLNDVPDKAKEVLALTMIGMSGVKIARLLKCSKSTIEGYLRRYDPDGKCRVTSDMRRKITSEMLMTTGVSALLEITDDKLEDSSASELSQIASRCVTAAERIRALDKGRVVVEPSRIDSMMDSLDTAVVEED